MAMMQRQVGKGVDDPHVYLNYRSAYRGTKVLPNGNTEEQYDGGGPDCKVYFEIDRLPQKIIGWRYEGGDKHCVIVP